MKLLAGLGVIWNVKAPPASVIRNEQRLGTKVIEKVAAQLALNFPVEQIVGALRHEIGTARTLEQFKAQLAHYRCGEDVLPLMPCWAELRRQAARMVEKTPSLDDILICCRSTLADAVTAKLEEHVALGMPASA